MPCGSSSERELEVDGQVEQLSSIYVPGAMDQRVILTYPLHKEMTSEQVESIGQRLADEFPIELKQRLGMSGLSLCVTPSNDLQVSTTVYGLHVDAESIIPHVTDILTPFGVRPLHGHPATHIYEASDGQE